MRCNTSRRCDDGPVSTPSADVSVRIAWADDAEAIAAIQARAWATSYAGLVPAAGDLREADFAQLWRDALDPTRPTPATGPWSRWSATASSGSRSPHRRPTPTATPPPTAS